MGNNWNDPNWGYPNNAFAPKMRTPVVNGREAAEIFRLGPDSNVILMDQSGKMIWIVATDSAGYRTVQPYDISLHTEPEPPDYNLLLSRMNKMEEMLSGFISAANSARTNSATEQPVVNSTDTKTNSNASIDLSKQF